MALKAGGARKKGFRAESEVCKILTQLGVPSQRVLASGSFVGAEADIKIGVELDKDGNFPEKDEGKPFLRAECKNRKTNDPRPYQMLKDAPFLAIGATVDSPEQPFKDLAQSPATKVLIQKRAKTPPGALTPGRYNEAYLVSMGLEDFAAFVRRLIVLERKVAKLSQ